MHILIIIGAVLSLLGVAGLGYCVFLAMRAKREAQNPDEMRAKLQRVVAMNMGALGVSALGLMLVVAGIALG